MDPYREAGTNILLKIGLDVEQRWPISRATFVAEAIQMRLEKGGKDINNHPTKPEVQT